MSDIDDWIAAARRRLAGNLAAEWQREDTQPSAAIVAPADLPVDPQALCAAPPGAFYTIRTAGGLVPPAAGDAADRGFAAALEYAVGIARVDHIVLVTHSDCGLLRCLLDADAPHAGLMVEGGALPAWTAMIAPAVARAARADIPLADRLRFCAQEMIRVSIENLMTYPWVLDGAYSGRLGIHGWYCDPRAGTLSCFDPQTDRFD